MELINMRIAVIGGGAAGFFGAISAAQHNPKAKITIFESTDQPLDKVRISGGGRCNVTHNCMMPPELVKGYPRGYKELLGPFNTFGPKNTIVWFTERGVKLKAEKDGRMFPVTDSSSTIIDCLMKAAADAGIQLRLNTLVKKITQETNEKSQPIFTLELHETKSETFDRVLIATGSGHQGYRFAQSLGHTIVTCVPSLFTFKISDLRLNDLSGNTFEQVHLTLSDKGTKLLEQRGPMLVTHWGLSGPAVLKLSAWGARMLHERKYHADLFVNFVPDSSQEDVLQRMRTFKDQHGRKRVMNDSPFDLPKRFWSRIVDYVEIPEVCLWSAIKKEQLAALCEQLTQAKFAIIGKGIFKEEFVTCGGVALNEVDFRTMQSKVCPGLYLAGEVLDIDGITGGFNFQSAWTTGWIAGKSIGH